MRIHGTITNQTFIHIEIDLICYENSSNMFWTNWIIPIIYMQSRGGFHTNVIYYIIRFNHNFLLCFFSNTPKTKKKKNSYNKGATATHSISFLWCITKTVTRALLLSSRSQAQRIDSLQPHTPHSSRDTCSCFLPL